MNSDFSEFLPLRAADTVILDTDNPYASGTIDAILTYCGYASLIGQTTDIGFETVDVPNNIKYNKQVASRFSKAFCEGTLNILSAKDAYGKALTEAEDGGAVLITVDFLNTAAEALHAYPELFAEKVRCVVSMAENFNHPEHKEWNVFRKVASAKYFFENCPAPIIFAGIELGFSFRTGFAVLQPENPVSLAYELHGGGMGASFDLCAVDIAVRGISDSRDWTVSEPFGMEVLADGALKLTPDPKGLRVSARFADEGAMERIGTRMNAVLRRKA